MNRAEFMKILRSELRLSLIHIYSTKANATNGSKTGDTMPIGMLAVLMLAAAAGIVFCGRKLYKSR